MSGPHPDYDPTPPVPVQVQLIGPIPVVRKERPFTALTKVITPALGGVLLLGHAPNRVRAVITVVGQSTDVGYLAGSESDAEAGNGMTVMGLQVVTLTTTGELWAALPAAGVSLSFGVVQEFED